jgi:hypothetical protein
MIHRIIDVLFVALIVLVLGSIFDVRVFFFPDTVKVGEEHPVVEDPADLNNEKVAFLLEEADALSSELSALSAKVIDLEVQQVKQKKYISALESRIIALEK